MLSMCDNFKLKMSAERAIVLNSLMWQILKGIQAIAYFTL